MTENNYAMKNNCIKLTEKILRSPLRIFLNFIIIIIGVSFVFWYYTSPELSFYSGRVSLKFKIFISVLLAILFEIVFRLDNKKKRTNAIFYIIFFAICLILFQNFFFGPNYYVYGDVGGDTLRQYYPNYVNVVENIKNGTLSIWNWTYGMGTSLLATNDWNLEPFGILPVLGGLIFGTEAVAYSLPIMQIIKLLCIFILTKMYLRFFLKKEFSVNLAAFLCSFNGYIFLWGQHFFMGTACFFLIFILYALERFIQYDFKKGGILLSLSVGLCLFCSYYFGYMILLVSGVYFLVRFYMVKKFQSIKTSLSIFAKTLWYVVIGILLSGIIFIPAVTYITSISRRLDSISIIDSIYNALKTEFNIEYILTRLSRMLSNNLLYVMEVRDSNYYELPQLFCSTFIFFFILQWLFNQYHDIKKGKKSISIVLIIILMTLLAFGSVTGLILYMFADNTDRYTFLVFPFLAICIGQVCDENLLNGKFDLMAILLGLVVSLITLFFSYKRCEVILQKNVYIILGFILVGTILLFFIWKNRLKKSFIKRYLTYSFVFILLISNLYDNYNTTNIRYATSQQTLDVLEWDENKNINNNTVKAINWIQKEDKSLYRIDKTYADLDTYSDPVLYLTSSVTVYNSVLNRNLIKYFENMYSSAIAIEDMWYNFTIADDSDVCAIGIAGVKYILSKDELQFENLIEIKQIGDVRIYQNTEVDSIEKWYTKTISVDEYTAMSEDEKTQILSDTVICNKNLSLDEDSSLKINDLSMVSSTNLKSDVECNGKGILFLSIPYEDGWDIYVDNVKVKKLKVDYGFTGVELKEGKHEIVLKYHFPNYILGIFSSILGMLLLILSLMFKNHKIHLVSDSLTKAKA